MKARVILSFVAASNTTGTQISSALNAALTGRAQHTDAREPNQVPAQRVGETDGRRRVRSDVRFATPADATAFFTQATTEFNQARVLPGSVLSMHNCAHDEPEANWYDCRTDARAAYQELVK